MALVASVALAVVLQVVGADYTVNKVYLDTQCQTEPIQVANAFIGCTVLGAQSATLTCTGAQTGNLVLYSTADCSGTPAGSFPLDEFATCEAATLEGLSPALMAFQSVTCVTGDYVSPVFPAPYSQSSVYSLTPEPSTPCTGVPQVEAFYPDVNACFTDGVNSGRMACTPTSPSLVLTTYTGLTCAGTQINSTVLGPLNAACTNGSIAVCVTAPDGVSETTTPSGTPTPSQAPTFEQFESQTNTRSQAPTFEQFESPTNTPGYVPPSNPSGPSAAVIGGSIGGSVAAVAVIAGAVFFVRRRSMINLDGDERSRLVAGGRY